MFANVLEENGPLHAECDIIMDEMKNLPGEAQAVIADAGGLGKFLSGSLQFTVVDDFVCLMTDLQKAREKADEHKQKMKEKLFTRPRKRGRGAKMKEGENGVEKEGDVKNEDIPLGGKVEKSSLDKAGTYGGNIENVGNTGVFTGNVGKGEKLFGGSLDTLKLGDSAKHFSQDESNDFKSNTIYDPVKSTADIVYGNSLNPDLEISTLPNVLLPEQPVLKPVGVLPSLFPPTQTLKPIETDMVSVSSVSEESAAGDSSDISR